MLATHLRPRRFLLLLALLLAMAPPAAFAATTTILYDASLGTAPEPQGWLTVLDNPFNSDPAATETLPGDQLPKAVTFDSTIADGAQGGYSRSDQSLDRTQGYTLRFDLQLLSENHSNASAQKNPAVDSLADRAGVSVIALSSDLRGIELGFWVDDATTAQRVWAQNDGPVVPSTQVPTGTLFTHGEGAAITTTDMTRYDLVIQGDGYRLYSAGQFATPILSGTLRDYRANANPPFGLPDPYETPNFIFIGDNTTSARGSFRLARVDFTDAAADTLPPPTPPAVNAISLLGSAISNAASYQFRVSFDQAVRGVDTGDFRLSTSGPTGATVQSVVGSGAVYTVTVATGSGNGSLRLEVQDDDSILSTSDLPLGGSGNGNGDFVAGPVLTLDRIPPSATLVANPQALAGSDAFTFTVIYSDNLALDVASLGEANLLVSGPDGLTRTVTFVRATPPGDLLPKEAIYRIDAPGGRWGFGDDGAYSFSLQPGQVRDSAGNAAPGGTLGVVAIKVVGLRRGYLSLLLSGL